MPAKKAEVKKGSKGKPSSPSIITEDVARIAAASGKKKAATPKAEPKVEVKESVKVVDVKPEMQSKGTAKKPKIDEPPKSAKKTPKVKDSIDDLKSSTKSEKAVAQPPKEEKKVAKVAKNSEPSEDVKVLSDKSSKKRSRKQEGEPKIEASPTPAPVQVDLTKQPSTSTIKLACEALLQHVSEHLKAKKQKLALPGVSKESSQIFLQIGLRNMPEQALKTFKGRPITLPHPFRDVNSTSICMFVKDKQEAKKWLGDDYQKVGIAKIIALQQIRTDYNSFKALRELANMYDVFLSDDRIACMLPKALGKAFYSGPKRPLPIRLAVKEKLSGNITTKVKKALGSAYFYLSGVSTSVRFGTTDLSAEQLVANVESVVNGAVAHIPGKWKGVQSIFIKSERSAALPLYEAVDAPVDAE